MKDAVRGLLKRRKKPNPGKTGSVEGDVLVEELRGALSIDRVKNDAAQRTLLSHDASVYTGGNAGPVCYPISTDEVKSIMEIAERHGRSVVPRGAGTGITGGAVPMDEPVMIALNKMNRVLEIDAENRVAWVEAGVVNLELTKKIRPMGLHFAPDPSSQSVCTIGGNVANNAGGPHCLAYGVTGAHILAIEVVLPGGNVVMLGGVEPEPPGYDLRGAFIGSEGTLGIATRIAVLLTPNPPEVRTLLLAFDKPTEAAAAVSAIIAAGIVPAALELMDQQITVAVENFINAGYPTDAGAILLAEVDGLAETVDVEVEEISRIAQENRAMSVRVAADEAERVALWKGRKHAFGAIAQIAPDYYLHDTVVPRSALATVLEQLYDIAERYELAVLNVFHAGDGNLHPILSFDAREPGVMERVHAAGAEIVEASIAAGGVLSGEHGIGLEKQKFMHLLFSDDDLDHQNRLRTSFDPHCRTNPGKIMPIGHSCADVASLRAMPKGVWG